MANAQGAAVEAEEGQSWYKTILNAVAIFVAVNAVTSFIGGRLGGQKNVTAPDGTVKPATPAVEQFPALWNLGTKMVRQRMRL